MDTFSNTGKSETLMTIFAPQINVVSGEPRRRLTPTYYPSTYKPGLSDPPTNIMRRWNYPTSEMSFESMISSQSYVEQANRPDLVGACSTQSSEAPSIPSDAFLDRAIACYDLSVDFLSESPEVSTTTLTAAANLSANLFQFPHPERACLRRTSSTSANDSNDCFKDRTWSSNDELCSQMPIITGPSLKRRRKTQGQPKLDPVKSYVPAAPSASQHTTRVPHNVVERKYREGLNTELERLRKAVPTLLQSHEGSSIGQPKPSKSMVIVAAINHIEMITQERNILQEKNDEIREFQNRSDSRERCAPKKRRVDLLSE